LVITQYRRPQAERQSGQSAGHPGLAVCCSSRIAAILAAYRCHLAAASWKPRACLSPISARRTAASSKGARPVTRYRYASCSPFAVRTAHVVETEGAVDPHLVRDERPEDVRSVSFHGIADLRRIAAVIVGANEP
jgi:hypothetical protein